MLRQVMDKLVGPQKLISRHRGHLFTLSDHYSIFWPEGDFRRRPDKAALQLGLLQRDGADIAAAAGGAVAAFPDGVELGERGVDQRHGPRADAHLEIAAGRPLGPE